MTRTDHGITHDGSWFWRRLEQARKDFDALPAWMRTDKQQAEKDSTPTVQEERGEC